jgi:NAD(P) transhydrogenase subunit beta
MNIELLANLSYIVSAALFIFGLKLLGSPATARRGNMFSSLGMLIAIVAGLTAEGIVSYEYIAGGMVLGAIIGSVAARLVGMTSMPEMVALFNGSGGAASLLVGWATLYGGGIDTFTAVTILLAILIGGLTFTGSLIAYAKLAEVMNSAAIVFKGQRIVNTLLLAGIVYAAYMFCLDPQPQSQWLYITLGLALLLGVMAVIPIGGADMPVVISLLYS